VTARFVENMCALERHNDYFLTCCFTNFKVLCVCHMMLSSQCVLSKSWTLFVCLCLYFFILLVQYIFSLLAFFLFALQHTYVHNMRFGIVE
jgi:hypothetical protein